MSSSTPGGLTRGTLGAGGASATNGVVTFSGVDSDLTSRVNIIDAASPPKVRQLSSRTQ